MDTMLIVLLLSVLTLALPEGDEASQQQPFLLGWPISAHHSSFKNELSPAQSLLYDEYMQGCAAAFSQQACTTNEQDRQTMNARQPSRMRNYTQAGYAKSRVPSTAAWKELQSRYHHGAPTLEHWHDANVHTNHWAVPTLLRGSTNSNLVRSVQEVLENWSGQSLAVASVYGVREYQRGSILAPHVDRYVVI